jgi:hypothetical protein
MKREDKEGRYEIIIIITNEGRSKNRSAKNTALVSIPLFARMGTSSFVNSLLKLISSIMSGH